MNALRALFHRLLSAWHERAFVLKAASFASVGFINSLIDFAVFWVAVQYFGMALIPANVLSWLVAITNSFVMNSFITFARESGRKLRWRTTIANSQRLKDYATSRAALFTPIHGQQAYDEAWKMVRQTAWLYFDGGKARVSPETLGIVRL